MAWRPAVLNTLSSAALLCTRVSGDDSPANSTRYKERIFPLQVLFLSFTPARCVPDLAPSGLPRPARTFAIQAVYELISRAMGLTLFAAVVDKPAFAAKYEGRVDAYRGAFEGLSTMFNFFLERKQRQSERVGRGVVVFDEARPSLSREIRRLLAEFQAGGTRWASLGCIIETAFFFDSSSSRLMQIADFAAYAVYRWYEHGDDTYLKLINNKFDRLGSRLHGLKCYPLECTRTYPPRATL